MFCTSHKLLDLLSVQTAQKIFLGITSMSTQIRHLACNRPNTCQVSSAQLDAQFSMKVVPGALLETAQKGDSGTIKRNQYFCERSYFNSYFSLTLSDLLVTKKSSNNISTVKENNNRTSWFCLWSPPVLYLF